MQKINKTKFNQLIDTKPKLLVVDARSPVAFRDGHIDKSINLPLRNFVNYIMKLPKTTPIVVYSTNFDDVDLVQGMKYAGILGFTELYGSEYGVLK